jgi:hypothetical protein
LNKSEVHGLVLPHFKHFDVNADSTLDRDELTAVLDWLNRHHQPGAPLGSRTNVNDR